MSLHPKRDSSMPKERYCSALEISCYQQVVESERPASLLLVAPPTNALDERGSLQQP